MKDFIGLEKMKTLSEHNREMKDPLAPLPLQHAKAGVACDTSQCGAEMLFSNPSFAPLRKLQVHCPECGQTGYFVVERAKINRRQLKGLFKALFTIQKMG